MPDCQWTLHDQGRPSRGLHAISCKYNGLCQHVRQQVSAKSTVLVAAQRKLFCTGWNLIQTAFDMQLKVMSELCGRDAGHSDCSGCCEIASGSVCRQAAQETKHREGGGAYHAALLAAEVPLDLAQGNPLRSAAKQQHNRSAEHACFTGARGAVGHD